MNAIARGLYVAAIMCTLIGVVRDINGLLWGAGAVLLVGVWTDVEGNHDAKERKTLGAGQASDVSTKAS